MIRLGEAGQAFKFTAAPTGCPLEGKAHSGVLLDRARKRSESLLRFRCAPALQLASLNSCCREQVIRRTMKFESMS